MRRVCLGAATAAAGWGVASAAPSKTFPPPGHGLEHGTRFPPRAAAAPTPLASQCGWHCAVGWPLVSSIDWVMGIPRELVVATVVLTVNNQTNTTSTSTKVNDITSLLLDNTLFPPNPTNADGTVVTTVTWSGRTTVLAFPTVVGDYQSSYTVAGSILVRAAANTSTCSVVGGGDPDGLTTVAPTPLPSHPALRLPPQPLAAGDDPRGLFSVPRWSTNYHPAQYMTSLFPDIAAFTGCLKAAPSPETALDIASFLTETSVNYVNEPGPSQPATTHATAPIQPAPTAAPFNEPAAASVATPSNPPPAPTPTPTPDPVPAPADSKELPTPAPAPAPISPTPPNLVAGANTLIPGAPAITVGGTHVSLAPDGATAVVGSRTVTIPAAVTAGAPTIVLGGATFTPSTPGAAPFIEPTLTPLPLHSAAVSTNATTTETTTTGAAGTEASGTETAGVEASSGGATRRGGRRAIAMAMVGGIVGMAQILV